MGKYIGTFYAVKFFAVRKRYRQNAIGKNNIKEITPFVTLERMNAVRKELKKQLREDNFKVSEMFGRQHDAYFASQLSKYNKTKISRGIQSSSIAAAFPSISNGIFDDQGIFIGENKYPVFIDFFKRDSERVNSNMVIIGRPGSGKSFAAKTLLANLAAEDSKIYVMDPENEYGKLAKNLGGKVIDVGTATEGRLNPFQIIEAIDDEIGDTSASYYAHLQFLEEFFRLILPGINQDSMEMLNHLIIKMYENAGITDKNNFQATRSTFNFQSLIANKNNVIANAQMRTTRS